MGLMDVCVPDWQDLDLVHVFINWVQLSIIILLFCHQWYNLALIFIPLFFMFVLWLFSILYNPTNILTKFIIERYCFYSSC